MASVRIAVATFAQPSSSRPSHLDEEPLTVHKPCPVQPHSFLFGLSYPKNVGLCLLPCAFTIVTRHEAKTSKTPKQDNHRVQNNKHIAASHQCKVTNPTTLTAVT
jgi:hypothetical protein